MRGESDGHNPCTKLMIDEVRGRRQAALRSEARSERLAARCPDAAGQPRAACLSRDPPADPTHTEQRQPVTREGLAREHGRAPAYRQRPGSYAACGEATFAANGGRRC